MTDLGIAFVEPSKMAAWVDNWVRLGLVEAAYDRYLTADHSYDWVEVDALYYQLKNQAAAAEAENPDVPGVTWGYDRGFLSPTAFGVQFRTAVMSFESPGTLMKDQPPGS